MSSLGNTSRSSLLSIRMLVRGSLPACCPPWTPGDRSLLLFPIPVQPGASWEPGPDYHLEHKAWFASLQAVRFTATESPASVEEKPNVLPPSNRFGYFFTFFLLTFFLFCCPVCNSIKMREDELDNNSTTQLSRQLVSHRFFDFLRELMRVCHEK